MVEEFVEAVEAGRGRAVDVVPPIADKVLLVEHGAVGAEEAVEVAVGLAHVENLAVGAGVAVNSGQKVLAVAVETGFGHRGQGRVVNAGLTGNRGHLTGRN